MNRIDCFKKKSFQKSPEKIHKESSLYSKWHLIFLGFRLRKVHESAKNCSKQDSTAITKKQACVYSLTGFQRGANPKNTRW
jgi:hypothetical protein